MENTNCLNFGGEDSMLEDTAGRNMTANPYDENSTYMKGAICIQNNKLYESNKNIDVAEQFTESHWTEITLGDIVSKNKSDIIELNENILASSTYSGKEITMPWSELQAKIRTGDFSGLHIGDYKDIVLTTGEKARLDLSGFNTYMNVGDTPILTEPHLYFTFRDCLETTYQMNSSNTNTGGYGASALANTVNTTIYNTLPADLRAVMKEVRRLENNKGAWAWASRKLWLLMETEVFGRNNWSDGYDGGGIQLPIFAHSYRHIVKGLGKGAAERGSRTNWWLASPYVSNTTTFCNVNDDGNSNSHGASEYFGVAPGFIIA